MKKNNNIYRILVVTTSLFLCSGCTQLPIHPTPEKTTFIAIPLGTKGGSIEANLSAYLLAPAGETNFIALDAGTLLSGLQQAKRKGSLQEIKLPTDSPLSLEGEMLRNHIQGYAISHAHIDHVAGLVINAPNDSPKPIFGLPSTINNIRDHLFNWDIWPNFADEGNGFQLKKYHYIRLTPGEKQSVKNTKMVITPYELSHSKGYISTAFLIECNGEYILYFGDVGPDLIEKSDKMQQIWMAIAPLIRKQKLHGIFLEASFPNSHPDNLLFGHLTPKWMIKELQSLAKLVAPKQPETALQGLKVVVTHIKPTLNRNDTPESTIMNELSALNHLGLEFILPESGKRIVF